MAKRPCVVGGGHAWQGVHGQGTCMGRWEHAWQCGGVNGKGGMCAGETAIEAGDMHPVGMHSCLKIFAVVFLFLSIKWHKRIHSV